MFWMCLLRRGGFIVSTINSTTDINDKLLKTIKIKKLQLKFRLPQPKRLERATSQEVAFFMLFVHLRAGADGLCGAQWREGGP